MWDVETGDLAVPEGARRPQSGREGGARSWGMGGTEGAYFFQRQGGKRTLPTRKKRSARPRADFLGNGSLCRLLKVVPGDPMLESENQEKSFLNLQIGRT